MIDMRDRFLMPAALRATHHLEGMNLTNNTKVSAYHNDTGKTMIFTKSKQGFPADRKAYDANFIYDTGTELNWKSASDFKQMTPQMAMCPRYWNGDPTLYQFHQHAAYDVYQNCAVTGHGDVGPAYFTLEHLGQMDYQGDVGSADTILLTYYWGMDPTKTYCNYNREQLFLTDTAGWVDWTHSKLQQLAPGLSQYIVDTRVTHNMIVPGVITPQFPCFPIP